MAYVDYSYYQEFFAGTKIKEESTFRQAAERASDYLDAVTFGRLCDGMPVEYTAQIMRCCCEMAEQIYSISLSAEAEESATGTSSKASESIGAYSVTYRTAAEGISAQLHGTSAGLEDLLQIIARKHLGRTGLLYRGV